MADDVKVVFEDDDGEEHEDFAEYKREWLNSPYTKECLNQCASMEKRAIDNLHYACEQSSDSFVRGAYFQLLGIRFTAKMLRGG